MTASLRRRVVYALATNDRFEAAVHRAGPLIRASYSRARRYVAGERFQDAVEVVERLHRQGMAASIDFFGEQVANADEASAAADAYVSLARCLGELPADTSVAIDLSHIGLDISSDLCRRQLERVVEALPTGRRIDVGAEDSSRTDATHAVVLALARLGAPIQMTLQANLRRTANDWRRLVEAGLAIRLVKGAYVERGGVAVAYGEDADVAYLHLAHALHEAGARFALATHDRVVREALLAAFGPTPVEMLLGVRGEDAAELVGRGVPVRLYVPYGEGWFRYWMRRVAEAQGA
jgi:proline dehydrogenase